MSAEVIGGGGSCQQADNLEFRRLVQGSESATTTQLQKSRRNQLNLQIHAGMVLLSFAYLCIGMGALDGFGSP